ncbi:MAG: 4-hydroxy-tetrahydrodipicolinate synthase [Eubacterium sp.]|nr:4-hydroxy-tetrahydrodipicolinate synthase [Eubacterium sp.]
MPVFTGAAVAIITPMNEDETVNYSKLDEIIEEQIAGSTDAIVICGTTGESATLPEPEHMAVVKHCVETVNHRVPVIAGSGSNSTASAIEYSQAAEAAGADALLVVTPYYNKATQAGLIRHYSMIAESVHTPIIMYNVPSRTGTNLLPETVAHLVKTQPNIVGIKEATGDLSQIAKLMALCGDEIELYSGNDDQIAPILSLGGLGVISVLSNVAPKYTHDMVMSYLNGDTKTCTQMQLKAIPLINALFCEVNPIPVKTAMNMMGKEVGPLRGPLFGMTEENKPRLRKALTDFGIEVTA